MAHNRFLKWLHRIYATDDGELDCDHLQSILPAYVEFELAGNDPAARYPQAKAHLAQCPDCAEEYEGLRAVAVLEARGTLPHSEESLAKFGPEAAPESAGVSAIPAP